MVNVRPLKYGCMWDVAQHKGTVRLLFLKYLATSQVYIRCRLTCSPTVGRYIRRGRRLTEVFITHDPVYL